ncbi:unnamed protein product [Phytophthora fragariaefolia]|uniref:RxLR effector protein n=1 Tax=Phytophthora fragariaefolia TaxID=1490495 RepID=A0A9W7D2C2_9STRA|nr:unnamed protein product [Phytophthora fragariaefolia]
MQRGLVVVLAAACLFASCDLVMAFVDKDPMVVKTDDMTSINGHLVYRRSLRTINSADGDNGPNEKWEDEDRANAFMDWVKSLLKVKKATPDPKRTFPSSAVTKKLARSQSLPSKKAEPMAKTLKRSESARFGLTLEQVSKKVSGAASNDLQVIYKMKKNPDDIVEFFKLDTKLVAKKGTTFKRHRRMRIGLDNTSYGTCIRNSTRREYLDGFPSTAPIEYIN